MIAINDTNFDFEIKKSEIPVLVDFWGEGCPPCTMIAPILEQLNQEYQGKIKIAKANVSDAPETARKFDIMAVPTLILFRAGEETIRHMGFAPKQQLIEKFSLNV